jgi:hypothetical protein
MKHIDAIPYEKVKFFFIKDHYDLHREGLCIFNNRISYFKINHESEDEMVEKEYEDENYHSWSEDLMMDIFELTDQELVDELFEKTMFELNVGYHWSYPHRKLNYHFHYRKPKWLYVLLFKLHYYLNKKNKP